MPNAGTKTKVRVNVTFSASGPSCVPDPVNVYRSSNNGVKWVAVTSGYTFTGVGITDGTNDFGPPIISENAAGKSVMEVTDSVADIADYTYIIQYTEPSGNSNSFDPTIKNKT